MVHIGIPVRAQGLSVIPSQRGMGLTLRSCFLVSSSKLFVLLNNEKLMTKLQQPEVLGFAMPSGT